MRGGEKIFPLKSVTIVLSMCWSAIILVSAIVNILQHEKEIADIIRMIGRSSIERDILYRKWNTFHGGIYVPVTETTAPNPYLPLDVVPLRDLKISADLTLTMINPAYMTRQVYELAAQQNEISGHITSNNPINPKNKPAPWEITALNFLEGGAAEYSNIATIDNSEYLQILLPLWTEKGCLKCHANQGYKEGDLRGGISISIPLGSFHSPSIIEHKMLAMAHLAIWAIGMLSIYLGYVALARKEAARLEAEKQIETLAHFDRLTGLVNRNLFHDRLNQALAMAKRHKPKVGLLYIDLDRFKPINDTFGHKAGDDVLQEMAKRLMESVRESDTVARIGGDEFIVIMQGLQYKREAGPVAGKILAALEKPFTVQGAENNLSASIGISCYPDDGEDAETLMKKADEAMYRVKNSNGGGFEFS